MLSRNDLELLELRLAGCVEDDVEHRHIIIELGVEKSDIGKIIGKKGKTIKAIRTLLMSVASRNGIRVNLEIIEDDKPRSSTP